MTRTVGEGWEVSVPGSTSNLGPGFDVLGMAVDRRLTARLRLESIAADGPEPEVDVTRSGTLAHLDLAPEHDYLSAPLLAHLAPGERWSLGVDSAIPFGRGMGSSAAARVAGEVLAELVGRGEVDLDAVLARAAAGEGHADNVAPSVRGGLVAVAAGSEGEPVVRLPVSASIAWGYVAPGRAVDTHASRGALPDAWDRPVVVRSLARLARLIPALADPGVDGDHLRGLLEDELHVPHRLPLVPGGDAARDAGRAAGAWAVTISGAGSGLLVLAAHDRIDAVLARMTTAFEEAGAGPVTAFPFSVETTGVRWSGLAP